MNRSIRIIGITLLTSALYGCVAEQDLTPTVNQVQDDEPQLAPEGAVLGDGLIAPDSPSLSIGTASNFASSPASSSISNIPIGLQRMTEPEISGLGVRTSTSAGSPSSLRVSGI